MNISLQLCGLVIALFLLILYKSHSTLGLKGEKIFEIVIIATCICLSLDMLSVLAIHFRSMLPIFCVKLICKAYLISMVFVGWGNLCYIMLDLNKDNQSHALFMRRSKLLTLAAGIIIAVLPISIFEDVNQIYSFGPAVISTYIFVLFFILSTLASAIFIRRKKSSRRGMVVIMTTILWILAAALQMYNNALLVVGFAMAVGIMIMYIVLENPDSNLDRQLGCFNSHAMQNYLSMCLYSKEKFHILDLSITDVKTLETRGVDVTAATKTVIKKLGNVKGIKIFKNLNTGLVIVSSDDEKLDIVSRRIVELVSLYPGAHSLITTFIVQNAEQFSTADELLIFLTYVRSQSSARLSAIVYVSENMIQQFNRSHEIEAEIDAALLEDRVEVFLQPICSADGIPSLAEALVRIRKKDGSMLRPDLFIPVAETTGQIKALGERVLEKVCEFLRDSEALSLGVCMIDVNLSAVQCDDSDLAGRLCQITESYGIDPKYISFEITETAVSEMKDTLIENMNALVSKGFCFALDDFGKGESNLMYIVEMPGRIIKMDMDMTKAYFSNPKARTVVEAIVAMAKKLNLITIAEGVETKDEVDGIDKLGIDYIQGYYFSKPLPMDEFIEFMRHNGRACDSILPIDTTEQTTDSTNPTISEQMPGNHHILLVDDHEMSRDIAQDILEDLGFTVDTAEDGTIGVDMIRNSAPGQYDFVLMDIRMPIMDGYEATRRIRLLDNKALASIPIIALTAQDTEEDRRDSVEAGMNGHLCKPLNGNTLTELVSEIFQNKVS